MLQAFMMCMHIHLVVANSHCLELVSWPIIVAELDWAVRRICVRVGMEKMLILGPGWNGTVW